MNIAVDERSSPYYALRDRQGNAIGVTACDIDGDGREEIYFLNTNNAFSGKQWGLGLFLPTPVTGRALGTLATLRLLSLAPGTVPTATGTSCVQQRPPGGLFFSCDDVCNSCLLGPGLRLSGMNGLCVLVTSQSEQPPSPFYSSHYADYCSHGLLL